MTDKQIIIDGVDVSGCGELTIQEDKLFICEITGYLCNDRQNCYYKQLKRAEQKIEKIKEIAVTNIQCDQCSNCDGVGLGECGDTNCSYYQMDRVLEIFEE